ncbi:hypothetical protein [Streptomyces sp. NPDC051636]|uniref:hypothetical protein n=1 Tax=Streptomyces sp. NPDC051636 TaxID=3365663 RepID=UPI00379FC43E
MVGEGADHLGQVSGRPDSVQRPARPSERGGPRRQDGLAGTQLRERPAQPLALAVAGCLPAPPESVAGLPQPGHGTPDTDDRTAAVQQPDEVDALVDGVRAAQKYFGG